jgi:hypothetical protein
VSENPAEPFTRADYFDGGRALFLTDPSGETKPPILILSAVEGEASQLL